MDITVIVPVFSGEKTIQELFEKIKYALINSYSFEVIFVHDGGTDSSWEKIYYLREIYGPLIRGIKLTQNFGQHNAILCGIEYTEANLIVTMDEDLQHNPEEIIKLIKCQKENGSDLVYGSYIKRKHSFFRNSLSFLLKSILIMIIPGLYKEYTSYRLIKKETAKKIISASNSYVFLDGLLARLNIKINSVKVTHFKSKIGKSSYSIWKLVNHTIKILFSFSKYSVKFFQRFLTGFFLILMSCSAYLILSKDSITRNYLSMYHVYMLILSLSLSICILVVLILLGKSKSKNDLLIGKPKYTVDNII